MNGPDKMKKQEQIETDKGEKILVADDELEKVTGGANFWFFDDERRKPKEKKNLTAEGK